MSLFIFGLLYCGLAALSMAMDRHYKQVWGEKPTASLRHILRITGWALLGVSFWISFQSWERGIGSIAWFGILTVAAFTFILLLTYRPKMALYAAPILPLITGAVAAI